MKEPDDNNKDEIAITMNKKNEIVTKWIVEDNEDELFDDYEDAYQSCIEREIIYYNKAMDYLNEYDWSLRESAEIASDLGFELKNINSEMLATLHLQDELIKSIKEIEYEQSED